MTLCSVEKLFIKKRSELPEEFWKNCVEHVKKVEESSIESDKIIDLQIEEVLIELDNDLALNAVDLTSVLSINIKSCEQKGNKFC